MPQYLEMVSLLIEFFGKDKLITDITDDDVRALIAWRRGHRASQGRNPEDCALITPAHRQSHHHAIEGAVRHLRPRVDEPEWRKLWLPVRQEHPRELMGDEGDRLEAAMRDDYAPLFAFAMATGMRQSECLLRWSRGRLGARQIRKTGKGGRLSRCHHRRSSRNPRPLRGHHPEFVFTYVAVRTHRTCG